MRLSFQNIANIKTLLPLCALILIAYFAVPDKACAQSDAGCDNRVWRAMANQAALETRRQDMMNKRYIVKADSVVQYSCLEDELLRAQVQTSRIFSNGEQWVRRPVDLLDGFIAVTDPYEPAEVPTLYGSPATPNGFDIRDTPEHNYRDGYVFGESAPRELHSLGITPNTLEESINVAVFEAYEFYIDGHFNHQVLSGTTPLESEVPTLCHNMASVWRAAKCKNFDGVNVFYRLEELVDFDPREFPPSMPCEVNG